MAFVFCFVCVCFTSEHLQGFGGVCFSVLCVFVSQVNTCKDLVAFVFLFSVFVSQVNTSKDLVAIVFCVFVCLSFCLSRKRRTNKKIGF